MKKPHIKKPLVTLLSCGALSLLMGAAPIGSTPGLAQAAESPVPLTATIHYAGSVKTLDGTHWKLASPVFEGAGETPFLNFAESRFNAGAGLNAIGGEYSASGSKLNLRNLFSTKMAGPTEMVKAEDRFLKALSEVQNFQLSSDGKTLTLYGAQELTFRLASAMQTLANTEWELVSPLLDGAEKTPFLNFTDSSIGAGVGLNIVGGEYSTSGQEINFNNLLSTKMAGPPALMEAEDRFLNALNQTQSFELSNNGKTLVLRGKQTMTFRLKVAAENLAGTEWELNSPTFAGASKTPYLNFTDEGIGAGVGLNIMGGGYSMEGSNLHFENLISTQMAGPPELMKAEQRFVKALSEVKSYELANSGKTLILRGGETLTFQLKTNMPQGFVASETKIINVAPQLGAHMDGDKTPKYLQLEDLSPRVGWGRFTEQKIEGFQFEPGYRYQMRVQVERNQRTNEQRLRLLEIFSQQWMESSSLAAGEKILEVAPTEVDCVGVGHTQCLQVREVGGDWKTMHEPIVGFQFQPGSRYRLQVKVTSIKNPSADASSLRYTLIRLLDKMPVTY